MDKNINEMTKEFLGWILLSSRNIPYLRKQSQLFLDKDITVFDFQDALFRMVNYSIENVYGALANFDKWQMLDITSVDLSYIAEKGVN